MSGKKEMDRTMNSTVYNKSRKFYLENKGLIRCSYCAYHRGENKKWWYGGFIEEGETLKEAKISYPPWKRISRNRKQWMEKNYCKISVEKARYHRRNTDWYYVTIEIGPGRKGIKYSKQ